MAIDDRLRYFGSNSDLDFQSWAGGIAQAFQAVGLIKTTDTGQITPSTHVRAYTGKESIQGYEVYRFADALQSTAPIFIKIEYGWMHTYAGTNLNYTSIPLVYITVGTATNGAGTLSGAVTSRVKFLGPSATAGDTTAAGTGTSNNNNHSIWTQGDGSSVSMVIGPQTSPQGVLPHTNVTAAVPFPAFLSVERSRDSAGVATGDGAVIMMSTYLAVANGTSYAEASGPTTYTQFISFLGSGASATNDQWPIAYPGNVWNTAALATEVYTFPLRMSTPRAAYGLSFIGTFKNDFAFGVSLSLTPLGPTTRTYRSLCGLSGTATNDSARTYVNVGMPNTALLMRWE